MESFHRSISTDHTECEGVILHIRCGQLLCTRHGRSVSASVTVVNPSITAQPIDMLFGLSTRVGPRIHVWLFSVAVFAHQYHKTEVSQCVKTLRRSRYTLMESFRRSILTDHAECEGVILHTRCGQLLHARRGRSVCQSVTFKKNLKTASFRL